MNSYRTLSTSTQKKKERKNKRQVEKELKKAVQADTSG